MPQSNIDFLKEALGTITENAKELEEALDELDELRSENTNLRKANRELEKDNLTYQEDWIDGDRVKSIDFGYGEVQYLEPDNVKLQIIMEEFKQKIEHNTFHTA